MEQQKKTDRTEELMEIARLRFGMIAPVIQETYPDESIMAYCRRVSETPMRLPDGRTVKYKPKTIGKWVSLYRNGGIDALTPKTRSDLGKTRVLTEEAIDEIYRIKQKYPRLNATQIHARLVQESLIPATVSVATVQRFVKRNGLKSVDAALTGRDRKAFEEAYFGGMYQADTCYLPYLEEHGKKHRTYLIMILDDYSRMIVGGRIFYQENAYNFQKVLKEAVAAYVKLITESSKWCMANKLEAAKVTSEWYGLDADIIAKADIEFSTKVTPTWLKNAALYPDMLNQLGQLTGALKGKKLADVYDLVFDFQFTEVEK